MNELRYVYAVTRPFEGVLPEGVRGLDGEPPRLLHHDGLVAVVSPVPAEDFGEAPLKKHLENLDWLSATARTHEAVVGALTTVTCPVPLRLATVCVDDSGVRRLLDTGRERFVQTLERLDGRVEWGIKVYAEPEPEPAREPSEAPRAQAATAAPATTGRDYLRRRLSRRQARESVWERADALSRRLHAELSLRAEAAALHRAQDARAFRGARAERPQRGVPGAAGDQRGIRGGGRPAHPEGPGHTGGTHRALGPVLLRRAGRAPGAAGTAGTAGAAGAGGDGPMTPPGTVPSDAAPVAQRELALVDLLDRLLAGGVVIAGDLTLRIADVDLVRVDLNALISSVNANVPSPFEEEEEERP